MPDVLMPVDVEQAFIDELSPFFTIGTSLPETMPAVFLRVVSVGGFQRDMVTDSFTVTLEAFAVRESQAFLALSQAVARVQHRQAHYGLIGSAVCYRLQIAALPQNFFNPNVPTHKRYISTLVPDIRRQSTPL